VLFLALVSCKPKEYQCAYKHYHTGGALYFSGFTAAELDTFYVEQYVANTVFLVRRDTMAIDSISSLPDTAFSKIGVSEGLDYKIYVPATASTYTITNISFPVVEDHIITSNYQCRDIVDPIAVDSLNINGKPTAARPGTHSYPISTIYLVK
jgi:hypothetical protein